MLSSCRRRRVRNSSSSRRRPARYSSLSDGSHHGDDVDGSGVDPEVLLSLVGAVVCMASTSVRAVVVGGVMGVGAVSGPWWGSDGGGFDDGRDGGGEGGWEPIFRRFSYDMFSIIVFL